MLSGAVMLAFYSDILKCASTELFLCFLKGQSLPTPGEKAFFKSPFHSVLKEYTQLPTQKLCKGLLLQEIVEGGWKTGKENNPSCLVLRITSTHTFYIFYNSRWVFSSEEIEKTRDSEYYEVYALGRNIFFRLSDLPSFI